MFRDYHNMKPNGSNIRAAADLVVLFNHGNQVQVEDVSSLQETRG